MSTLNRISPKLLSCRVLPHADARLAKGLNAPTGTQSLAFLTCDQDDSLYAALDHATKMAEVTVSFASSFFAGSNHASGPLSGEIIGVLAAKDPDTLAEGVRAAKDALDHLFAFFGHNGINIFPTVIASVGRYLSKEYGVSAGVPLGYFIAPPLEAMIGADAALKAGNVDLLKLHAPPSPTNFAGVIVSGTLDAVQASAAAFTSAIIDVATRPLQ
jgi:ethanolamine utilization protein EutL